MKLTFSVSRKGMGVAVYICSGLTERGAESLAKHKLNQAFGFVFPFVGERIELRS